jgi:hypothetical protein
MLAAAACQAEETSPRLGILHRVFPVRVMFRHDRPHKLGDRTGPNADKETGAMRAVVGRRLRDVDVG